MTFDASKTETFIPFLWVVGKSCYFLTLFGLLSVDIVNWSGDHSVSKDGLQLPTNTFDRCILIFMLHFVLIETQVDRFITRRNESFNKSCIGTLLAGEIRLCVDIFFSICILICAKKQSPIILISSADTYASYAFYCVWLLVFCTVFTCEMLHVYRQEALLETPFVSTVKSQQNVVHIVMITLLSFSFTSPHLQLVLHNMEFPDFIIRVLVYTFFVCFRVYTTTASMSSLILACPIPARAQLGWILIIPTTLVYVAACVPFLFHLILFTSVSRKKSILPTHIPQTDPTPLVTPTTLDFIDHSDIISKLKILERQQAIEPHSNTSTKRRTAALF